MEVKRNRYKFTEKDRALGAINAQSDKAVNKRANSLQKKRAEAAIVKEVGSRMVKEQRLRNVSHSQRFDPVSGRGSVGKRFIFTIDGIKWWLPLEMRNIPFIKQLKSCGSIASFCKKQGIEGSERMVMEKLFKLRCHHDFPYWCATCITVQDKKSGKNVKFILNYPQRLTCAEFERQRTSGLPIRVIILKARQWGGSTVTQMYMAWIQLEWIEGWHSAIVAHLSGAAIKIRSMYQRMINNYPPSMLNLKDKTKLKLTPFSGSRTDVTISQGKDQVRDNIISIGSMQSPEGIRSANIALAHFSEVGLWKKTDMFSPESIIQTVSGSILKDPMTMQVMESTAKGENNFFHKEWLDAKKGESAYSPIFIPWYMIEMYEEPFGKEEDRLRFATTLYRERNNTKLVSPRQEPGAYLWSLWERGATLENIHWYTLKRREFRSHDAMASEYPSDDIEAFAHSGQSVFDKYMVEKLREGCHPPQWRGEVVGQDTIGLKSLRGVSFKEAAQGEFLIWDMPDEDFRGTDRYVVSTDVGGRSEKSDYSCIVVIDRWWRTEGEGDSIVAEWHGHCRHEVLAWKMAQIATFYHNALLVVESNTYESRDNNTEGNHSQFILDQIGTSYRNMYAREPSAEKIKQGVLREWGFHTNVLTKQRIIDNLKYLINEGLYVEREEEALAEYNTYQIDERGSLNAAEGYHDDRLMARAIGLWVSMKMPIPKQMEKVTVMHKTYSFGNDITEAVF